MPRLKQPLQSLSCSTWPALHYHDSFTLESRGSSMVLRIFPIRLDHMRGLAPCLPSVRPHRLPFIFESPLPNRPGLTFFKPLKLRCDLHILHPTRDAFPRKGEACFGQAVCQRGRRRPDPNRFQGIQERKEAENTQQRIQARRSDAETQIRRAGQPRAPGQASCLRIRERFPSTEQRTEPVQSYGFSAAQSTKQSPGSRGLR